MRLLLRSNSHRALQGTNGNGLELASSPDTAGREAWQWHLRLDDAAPEQAGPAVTVAVDLGLDGGRASTLSLSTHPAYVSGRVEALEVDATTQVRREERELVALVAGRGRLLVEGRHHLGELDVLVLEGDDPFTVSVESIGAEPATLAVARLDPVDAARVAWVP